MENQEVETAVSHKAEDVAVVAQLTKSSASSETRNLPEYERGTTTRTCALLGIALTWIVAALAFAGCIYVYAKSGVPEIRSSNNCRVHLKWGLQPDGQFGPSFELGKCKLSKSLRESISSSYGKGDLVLFRGRPGIYGAIINILPLIATFIVTACCECVGYAHSVALRWSLWEENRPAINNNLRMFTFSKRSLPNGVFANLLFFTSVMVAQAAASQIVFLVSFPAIWTDKIEGHVSAVNLLCLSLGLFMQAAIATWAVYSASAKIKSWDSDPLNNALAQLHHGLSRVTENSTKAADESNHNQAVTRSRPKLRQTSMYSSNKATKIVLLVLWGVGLATVTWASIITLIIRFVPVTYHPVKALESIGLRNYVRITGGLGYGKLSAENPFVALFTSDPPDVALNAIRFAHVKRTYAEVSDSFQTVYFIGLVLYIGVQAYLVAGFHCAELITNVSRDEDRWRRATSRKGLVLSENAVKAAFTSSKTIILFVLKVCAYYILGRSCVVGFSINQAGNFSEIVGPFIFRPEINMTITIFWSTLYLLAGVVFLVAVYATILACWQPRGPQPATWGRFQTITELIDDWGRDKKRPLFWGDKGAVIDNDTEVLRHAGTTNDKGSLEEIRMDTFYTGIG